MRNQDRIDVAVKLRRKFEKDPSDQRQQALADIENELENDEFEQYQKDCTSLREMDAARASLEIAKQLDAQALLRFRAAEAELESAAWAYSGKYTGGFGNQTRTGGTNQLVSEKRAILANMEALRHTSRLF